MPFVKVNPALLLEHSKKLQAGPARYAFQRSDIRSFSIAQGSFDWSKDDIYLNNVPNELVVALVASKAFSGHSESNPFDFQSYALSYLSLEIDGVSYPKRPLQPVFSQDDYIVAYAGLFDPDRDITPNIEYWEYGAGYAIYRLRIENSKSSNYQNLKKTGNTRLTLRFREALPEPVTVVVYGKFNSIVDIDSARNVVVHT